MLTPQRIDGCGKFNSSLYLMSLPLVPQQFISSACFASRIRPWVEGKNQKLPRAGTLNPWGRGKVQPLTPPPFSGLFINGDRVDVNKRTAPSTYLFDPVRSLEVAPFFLPHPLSILMLLISLAKNASGKGIHRKPFLIGNSKFVYFLF